MRVMTTRKEIFEAAARRLRAEFDELRQIPHNGAKGSAAEDVLIRFLNAHLPKRFSASSGFVLDRNDQVSPQTDVVIYDAFNCPVYRASDKDGIFPADNVAAVVEVKSRLTTKDLEDSFRKIAKIKSLSKTTPRNYLGGLQLMQTMGCILAFESDLALDTTLSQYAELIKIHKIGPHPDLVVILNRGVLTLITKPRGENDWAVLLAFEGMHQSTEGSYLGVAARKLDDGTLDYFFRQLLQQLTFFRWVVDPSTQWAGSEGKMIGMVPLLAITHEKDPTKRAEIQKRYNEEMLAELGQHQ
jgi:hypothetical protein